MVMYHSIFLDWIQLFLIISRSFQLKEMKKFYTLGNEFNFNIQINQHFIQL